MAGADLMRERFKRIGQSTGLDRQVLQTLILRGWQIIAGGLMVVLIPIWLGKVEQGYYYTFSSLLALQIFFELGMNQVIMQLVSHDFAHLKLSNAGVLEGDAARIGRLASLVKLLCRWYGIAATLFFVVVSISGVKFFSAKDDLSILTWGAPWIVLTFATAINLYLSAALTVIEGTGEVAGVARMRLVQSIWGNGLMWLALAFGAGLWAIPLVPLVGAVYTACWLGANGLLLKRLREHVELAASESRINWRTDIFPFQWRIAVSWVSGYFIFQLFTPLTFSRFGAIEAGRLGISMAVFSALLTVGMSWVNAKIPSFAAHISRNERSNLNVLFVSVLKRSMIFTLGATSMIMLIVLILGGLNVAIVHRFAPLPVIACLAVVTLANCFIFAAAAYMRAHKEEPMMMLSIVTGVAALGAAAIGSKYNMFVMMASYALVTVGIALPWTAKLFFDYYRRTK